jgi:hypothetical protein
MSIILIHWYGGFTLGLFVPMKWKYSSLPRAIQNKSWSLKDLFAGICSYEVIHLGMITQYSMHESQIWCPVLNGLYMDPL